MQGLVGRKHSAGDARPVLVQAVEFPVTVVALDIAFRRYRKVNASESVSRRVVEARMFFNR